MSKATMKIKLLDSETIYEAVAETGEAFHTFIGGYRFIVRERDTAKNLVELIPDGPIYVGTVL